jgi:hypothetical protein
MTDSGVEIQLEGVVYAQAVALSLDSDDAYQAVFLQAGVPLTVVDLPAPIFPEVGLAVHTLAVPGEVVEKGFDSIRILPLRGSEPFALGHLILNP